MNPTIIVGYDESDRGEDALALARRFADLMDAHLVLANVQPLDPFAVGVDPYYQSVDPAIAERVTRVAEAAEAEAVMIVSGSPARGLHNLSVERKAELVVIGPAHRGHAGRVLAGSTGQRLLHGSLCPVAVAPKGLHERDSSPFRAFLVGYDGSSEAETAVERAAELARGAGAHLRIAMVAEPPVVVYGKGGGTAGGYMALKESIEEAMRAKLSNAVAAVSAKGIEASGEFASGEPAVVLAAAAADADLLIVGSRGYGPLRCVLLGSVSAGLIESSPCPVLIFPRGVDSDADADDRTRETVIAGHSAA